MDFCAATEVTRELDVPLPRLLRFVAGRDDVVREGNRVRLGPSAVAAAREYFGAIPRVEGLSRVEVQVLVALSRHPRGLISARQVAKAARVSAATAVRALARLEDEGLVLRSPKRVFDGEVIDREIYEVDWRSPRWREVAPTLAAAELPARPPSHLPRRLPPRLANVFWTGDWRKLDVPESTRYVAYRILNEGRHNPEALAFLAELPPSDVEEAVTRTAKAAV